MNPGRPTSRLAAVRIAQDRRDGGFGGLCFGGVAFKYQRNFNDLADACGSAVKSCDVVTAKPSGHWQCSVLGQDPRAIATGVSLSFEEFNPRPSTRESDPIVQHERTRSFPVSIPAARPMIERKNGRDAGTNSRIHHRAAVGLSRGVR